MKLLDRAGLKAKNTTSPRVPDQHQPQSQRPILVRDGPPRAIRRRYLR